MGLILVKDIVNSSDFSPFEQLQFAQKLEHIVIELKERAKELRFRKNAIGPIKSKDGKMRRFAKRMIKGYRYWKEEEIVESDVGMRLRFMDYSLDIALKTSEPHPKYKEIMHGLL